MLLIAALAAGCASEGDPAEAVEKYFQAKVESSEADLRGLLCSAMESSLPLEVASFASVEASLEGVSCTKGSTSGDYTMVTCEGNITALYGTENRDFPLGSYRTVKEDGEWKWCGEG